MAAGGGLQRYGVVSDVLDMAACPHVAACRARGRARYGLPPLAVSVGDDGLQPVSGTASGPSTICILIGKKIQKNIKDHLRHIHLP